MKRWTLRIIFFLILGVTMTVGLRSGCGVTGGTRNGDEPLELRFIPFAQAEDALRRNYPDELLFVCDSKDEPFMAALWSKGDRDAVLRSYRLSDGLAREVTIPDWVNMFGA